MRCCNINLSSKFITQPIDGNFFYITLSIQFQMHWLSLKWFRFTKFLLRISTFPPKQRFFFFFFGNRKLFPQGVAGDQPFHLHHSQHCHSWSHIISNDSPGASPLIVQKSPRVSTVLQLQMWSIDQGISITQDVRNVEL